MWIQEQLYEGWLRHRSSPEEWSKQWGIEWQESTCIAELTWLSGEFHLQPRRFLSRHASPIPRSIPNPPSLSFPTSCRPASLGLTLKNFSLPFQKWNSGGREDPFQCSVHSGWKIQKQFENSGGFHQTPCASMVRMMLITGTADSALEKVDNQIR